MTSAIQNRVDVLNVVNDVEDEMMAIYATNRDIQEGINRALEMVRKRLK